MSGLFLLSWPQKIIGAFTLSALLIAITWGAINKHNAIHWQKVAKNKELALKESENARLLFAERVKAKSEGIRRRAIENARRVEAAQTQISQESDNEIRSRIAAVSASVRAQASGGTHPGRGGNSLPGSPDATGNPAGAGQASVVVADRLICTEAIVKAEGWAGWWERISEIPR